MSHLQLSHERRGPILTVIGMMIVGEARVRSGKAIPKALPGSIHDYDPEFVEIIPLAGGNSIRRHLEFRARRAGRGGKGVQSDSLRVDGVSNHVEHSP